MLRSRFYYVQTGHQVRTAHRMINIKPCGMKPNRRRTAGMSNPKPAGFYLPQNLMIIAHQQ